ncbi:MAG: hypothetical protein C0189_03535 [Caldisericum exile]|jgi:hypothetical protein|uniref:Uncharacterized protein n=1 Tax=Caldisericum exile TaxID=693075 RepID=A0A2J6WE55_9BACT|nr:MAG: hypothetical protein C0189_03535 [Caldisericum exile]
MQKKIIVTIAVLVIIVLILGLINDLRAFVRKSLAGLYTANFGYFEIYKEVKGNLLFCAKNISADQDGSIQFLKDDFDFVHKDEVVGILSTKDGIVDILAPASGYFVKGFVNIECDNVSQLIENQKIFRFTWIESDKVLKDKPFASIVVSDLTVALPISIAKDNSLTIFINQFVKGEAKLVYNNEEYCFYEVSEFLPQILTSNGYLKILEKTVYGLKIPKNALIKKSGEYFIYIVNGNIIKDVKVAVFDYDPKFVVVKVENPDFNDFSSLIVVLTPRIFKIGDVVGNF